MYVNIEICADICWRNETFAKYVSRDTDDGCKDKLKLKKKKKESYYKFSFTYYHADSSIAVLLSVDEVDSPATYGGYLFPCARSPSTGTSSTFTKIDIIQAEIYASPAGALYLDRPFPRHQVARYSGEARSIAPGNRY